MLFFQWKKKLDDDNSVEVLKNIPQLVKVAPIYLSALSKTFAFILIYIKLCNI